MNIYFCDSCHQSCMSVMEQGEFVKPDQCLFKEDGCTPNWKKISVMEEEMCIDKQQHDKLEKVFNFVNGKS